MAPRINNSFIINPFIEGKFPDTIAHSKTIAMIPTECAVAAPVPDTDP